MAEEERFRKLGFIWFVRTCLAMPRDFKFWLGLPDELKLQELVKTDAELTGDYVASREFFEAERRRLKNQPLLGKHKIEDLDATPTKDSIRKPANRCPPDLAFCEILDNVLDNFRQSSNKALNVEMAVFTTPNVEEIQIRENSGGIPADRRQAIVQLGQSKQDDGGSIGTWGMGFKIALFSLGEFVQIFSHHKHHQPFCIDFGDRWLDTKEWDNVRVVSVEGEGLEQGSTYVRVRTLSERTVDFFRGPKATENIQGLVKHLGMVYGDRIIREKEAGRTVTFSLVIQGMRYPIVPRPRMTDDAVAETFSFPPQFEPAWVRHTFQIGQHILEARIMVGIAPKIDGDTGGLWMWGNGRLFLWAWREDPLGSWNHTFAKLHVYVELRSENPSDIPWEAPLKRGFDKNGLFAEPLRKAIENAVEPYMKYANNSKRWMTIPFSAEWNNGSEYNETKKREVLELAPEAPLPTTVKAFRVPPKVQVFEAQNLPDEARFRPDLAREARRALTAMKPAEAVATLMQGTIAKPRPAAAELPDKGGRADEEHEVSIGISAAEIDRLKEAFNCKKANTAVLRAVQFALRTKEKGG